MSVDTDPVTPDGRYFMVRGRLSRCSNRSLPEKQRAAAMSEPMTAGSAVGAALRAADKGHLAEARAQVDHATVALSERGQVWSQDGSPDFDCDLVVNTPYAGWLRKQDSAA